MLHKVRNARATMDVHAPRLSRCECVQRRKAMHVRDARATDAAFVYSSGNPREMCATEHFTSKHLLHLSPLRRFVASSLRRSVAHFFICCILLHFVISPLSSRPAIAAGTGG